MRPGQTVLSAVRDYDALRTAVDSGVEQLGRLDVIVANAGIGTTAGKLHKADEALWQQMLQPVPPAPCTNVFAASLAGLDLRLGGGLDGPRYLAVSRFCELLRHAANGTDPSPQVVPSHAVHGQHDQAVGRYVHLLIDGVDYRVY